MTTPNVLLVSPPDDAGAATADRYDWQALIAAVDFIATVADASSGQLDQSCGIYVICEHHEDFILCVDDTIQLVSVKHRDLSQGNWTFAKIFKAGGIAHLFDRWAALSEAAQARLVTNADLGTGDEAKLRAFAHYLRSCPVGPLSSKQHDLLAATSTRILKVLAETKETAHWSDDGTSPNAKLLGAVRRFLGMLTFDCARPHRHILASAAPSMYVTPFLQAIGRPPTTALALWEALGSLFRRRMRGRGEHTTEALAAVARKIHEQSANDDELASQVRERTITVQDLSELLEVAHLTGLTPVARGYSLAPTQLATKIINAGCQETTAHAAEAVAARWREREHHILASEVDAVTKLEKLKSRALVLASSVQEECAAENTSATYGPAMWRQLRLTLVPDAFPDSQFAMDEELALGLVCDLASQCQVWFSEAFDIDQAKLAFPNRVGVPQTVGAS
ncbi:dsDNA nuclease domain-containing protein [Mycolicibacterium sp. P9-22]|uniref:dsDNA nuclease domain-containing protein n=1 Tax=Mycolicibacterium sp. P9-22 TaxID=2024613 RepID=UPI0018835C57|nr:dsDNA nuclease domain-containing protein [Mycolicibacterium sp. P9-22]